MKRLSSPCDIRCQRLLLALLLLAVVPGCREQSTSKQTQKTAATAPADLPRIVGKPGMNVLLISVDTTRADHLGCYGHPTLKTPNIDRFASEGTRFEWCISSAPLTMVSHSTMLTGSYQYVHGVRDNGFFTLSPENMTLAELFKQAGYATSAETATVIMEKKFGLDQGFDHYGYVQSDAGDAVQLTVGAQPGAAEVKKSKDIWLDRKATEITRLGIDTLRRLAKEKKPFFVFLHYYDPHFPHEAPPPFSTEYPDGYYAEIAYFDSEFGKLINELDLLGLGESTLVVLTSDHGESRGQHGEYTHSAFLYDATQHVPLIMRCKNTIPAGQTVTNQVRLVDLAPSLLEFVGLIGKRTDQMQGVSLLTFLANPKLALDMPCYIDTFVTKAMYGYAMLRAMRTQDWKYILAPVPELYNLKDDPQEVINLTFSDPDHTQQFRQSLWELIEQSPPPPGVRLAMIPTDELSLEKLQALGYASSPEEFDELGEGNELDHFEPKGENPRDHAEEINLVCYALAAFRTGQFEVAESQFRRLLELDPNHTLGLSHMAQTLIKLNRLEEALDILKRAIKLHPDSTADYRTLGILHVMRGQYADAERAFREGLQTKSDDINIRLDLVATLSVQNRHDDALKELELIRKLDPKSDRALGLEAVIRFRLGKPDEALACLQKAVGINPKLSQAHIDIASLMSETGKPAEAIAYLRKQIEAQPDAVALYVDLASRLTKDGQLDQAAEVLQRAIAAAPESGEMHRQLAANLMLRGKPDEALVEYRRAVEVEPTLTSGWKSLAQALEQMKKDQEAMEAYDQILTKWARSPEVYRPAAHIAARIGKPDRMAAILRKGNELFPDDYTLANDLAWVLATSPRPELRDGELAVKLARKANAVSERDDPNFLDTLAAAYAEVGNFDEAIKTIRRAIEMAQTGGNSALADELKSRLSLYESKKPFREK